MYFLFIIILSDGHYAQLADKETETGKDLGNMAKASEAMEKGSQPGQLTSSCWGKGQG